MLAALRAELEQRALDRADARLGDIAIGRRELVGAIGDLGQHRAQIVEVEEQQPLLVGEREGDGQHALLHLVEVEQLGEQQRPHLGDGGADRMALLAQQIPEDRGVVGIDPVVLADLLGARGEGIVGLGGGRSGHRDTGQVALHVGQEHRHAGAGEILGDALQGDGLAGAGGARDQPVAVGALHHQRLPLAVRARADEDAVLLVRHAALP